MAVDRVLYTVCKNKIKSLWAKVAVWGNCHEDVLKTFSLKKGMVNCIFKASCPFLPQRAFTFKQKGKETWGDCVMNMSVWK